LLFTVVPREDRYKAKSFIDTIVYRIGDQVGAWSTALFRGLGLGTADLALVAIPFAAVWLVNAMWLGRRQDLLATQQALVPDDPPASVLATAEPAGDAAGD
jgi:AAA family ATP:ADP antiporter